MRRSLLKHQFEEYKASEEERLDGGYDKMQKILSKINTLKIKPDQEDINMKFLRGLPPSWANIAQIIKVKGDLDQVNKEAFDEYEIKHQMAMIAIKVCKFEKKYVRPVQFDSREAARFDKKLAKCFKCKKTCHFARECRSQVYQESTNYKNYKKKEAAKEAS
nr:ribonuclease H-like domain-containing protein [Tanacetum cinerariifolium]